MENEIYVDIKSELKAKPKKLTNLYQWLFVAVNTAKSIIDNTCKKSLDNVLKFADCIYLCSLVADFPDQELSDKDKELIRQYSTVEIYLLYEIE